MLLDGDGEFGGEAVARCRRTVEVCARGLEAVAALVRSSRERFDGSGHPDGLAGEAIPLGARIVAVCDAFDAMLSHRPWRPAMTTEAALAELRRGAGSQFDTAVVDAFDAVIDERSRLFA